MRSIQPADAAARKKASTVRQPGGNPLGWAARVNDQSVYVTVNGSYSALKKRPTYSPLLTAGFRLSARGPI